MNKAIRSCFLLLFLSAAASAQTEVPPAPGPPVDPKLFRYIRRIPDSPAGLTTLLLDAAVLAHSRNDFGDLRIIDSGNRQISYLLERSTDVFAAGVPLVPDRTASSTSQSRYQITLPFEDLPAAKLVLTTNERLFQRRITVQVNRAPAELRSNPTLETVAIETWRHNDPDTPAPPLALDLHSSLGTASATLIVDEGDNRALAISGARLELPLYRLRFFYPADGNLNLIYGQETLPAPRYDLELLAPRLVGVSSHELALNAEIAQPATSGTRHVDTRVFWAALVIAVGVVLFLLTRLLRL